MSVASIMTHIAGRIIEETESENRPKNFERRLAYKKDLERSLQPIQNAQDNLQREYDNMERLIDGVKKRNKLILKARYTTRLDEAQNLLEELCRKKEEQENEIFNNSEVKRITDEMESFVIQSKSLRQVDQALTDQINTYKESYKNQKDEIEQRKEELRSLTQENLKISYQLEDKRIEMEQESESMPQNSWQPPMSSKYSQGFIKSTLPFDVSRMLPDELSHCYNYIDEIEKLKRKLRNVQSNNMRVSTTQGANVMSLKDLEQIFNLCLDAAQRELIKSQKIALDPKKGLAGSLYFELLYSNIQNYKQTNPQGIAGERINRSQLQDRDSRNLVYQAVQRMVKTARQDKRKINFNSIRIPFDEFKKFTTMQILGLLCLRKDIVNELISIIIPSRKPPLLGDAKSRTADDVKPTSLLQNKQEKVLRRMIGQRRNIPRDLRLKNSRVARQLMAKHNVKV